MDELKFCCGQLVSYGSGTEHQLCDGKEAYPHPNCDMRFPMHPLKNLAHQDIIHRSIIVHSCVACRACFITEGAFVHHIVRGHGGPLGFEVDLNKKHEPEYSLRVPYSI